MTQAKFLHIEDSLAIGKLPRLFAGTYRKGNGMDVHTHHFMDVDDAVSSLTPWRWLNRTSPTRVQRHGPI
ncbi:MAG: hypothetical protein IPL78_27135 [Chloroflexi bacterium]|nr:hypothetical protein [Chloroflexota bacterium]